MMKKKRNSTTGAIFGACSAKGVFAFVEYELTDLAFHECELSSSELACLSSSKLAFPECELSDIELPLRSAIELVIAAVNFEM